MKITQFDRMTCKAVGNAMEAALKKIETEYGVNIRRKSGSFSPETFTVKFEVSVLSKDGTVNDKDAVAFRMFAGSVGLKESDLGRVFTSFSGKSYAITGFSSRSYKFPILAKDTKPNGRVFKFPAEQVKQALDRT